MKRRQISTLNVVVIAVVSLGLGLMVLFVSDRYIAAEPDIALQRTPWILSLGTGAIILIGALLIIRARKEDRATVEEITNPSSEFSGADDALHTELAEREARFEEKVAELEQYRVAAVNMLEDLTETKRNLERAQAYDDALIGSIADGVVALDPAGKITLINDAALGMLGLDGHDILGTDGMRRLGLLTEDGKPVDDSENILKSALGARDYRTFESADYHYRSDDGTLFPIRMSVAPIISNGRNGGVVATFRDISEERRIERAKTEFVSLAAHQLRTPLTTIGWHTEILMTDDQSGLTRSQIDNLREIYEANRRMVVLVDAFLSVSRLELGTVAIDPVMTDLPKLTHDFMKDMLIFAKSRDVVVEERYQEDMPVVNIDHQLWGVIVQNLVSNAIKYTAAKGKTTVELFLEKTEHDIVFRVEDNGIGIPKVQQPKLFTKLFRADNAQKLEVEGTGLGLYLVKLILDHVGGDISFESEEGKGSTFTVRIPDIGMTPHPGGKRLARTNEVSTSS